MPSGVADIAPQERCIALGGSLQAEEEVGFSGPNVAMSENGDVHNISPTAPESDRPQGDDHIDPRMWLHADADRVCRAHVEVGVAVRVRGWHVSSESSLMV